jgi:hypothetical protein
VPCSQPTQAIKGTCALIRWSSGRSPGVTVNNFISLVRETPVPFREGEGDRSFPLTPLYDVWRIFEIPPDALRHLHQLDGIPEGNFPSRTSNPINPIYRLFSDVLTAACSLHPCPRPFLLSPSGALHIQKKTQRFG